MRQQEMSRYLKAITIGVGILFLVFITWFLPSVFRQVIVEAQGVPGYWGACIIIWVSAVPVFLCIWKFWGVCTRIGRDESFSRANATALKQMSFLLLIDSGWYAVVLLAAGIWKWYVPYGIILLFGIVLILAMCISLTVLCASLSHLVYKASELQEDHELTI